MQWSLALLGHVFLEHSEHSTESGDRKNQEQFNLEKLHLKQNFITFMRLSLKI